MKVQQRVVATAVGLLLAAAACTGSPGEPTASPTTQAGTPSATSSPSPTTESELAAANAVALVHEYYRVTDSVAKDPAGLEPLGTVAGSSELTRLQDQFTTWAHDGWRQTGEVRVLDTVVQTVSLNESTPSAGEAPTVQVDVCFDVSALDIIDASGTSQVAAGRPDRGWERLSIANEDLANDPDDGWRVADVETVEQEPCAGQ